MTKGLQGSLRKEKKKKSYKLDHDSLHFRLFHRLILGTISAPWFILTAKTEKKSWAFVDVCAAPSVLDVRWQILTWQLGETATLPSHGRGPRGTAEKKAENVSSFRGFQGTGKKICLMRPRDVSPSREKKTLSAPPPRPSRRGGREGKQTRGGRRTHVFKCVLRAPKP